MAAIDVQVTASPTIEITHSEIIIGGEVTEQINGVTIGTSESGDINNQVIENSSGTPVGTAANPSVVPDASVQLNGVDMVDISSGETGNIEIRQSTGATQVGSKQGVHWRIDDSTIENSDSSYSVSVKSEDSLVIPDTSISANGDLVADQPSTIAKDITVRYETLGTVPTTISGGEVVVPDVTPTTPLSYLGGKALSTDGVSDRAVGNVCGHQYYPNFGVGFMFNDPTSAVGSAKGLFGFGTSLGQNNYNSLNLWCFPNQTRWFLNMPDGQATNYIINLSKDTDTHIYLQVGSSNIDVYLDGSLYGTFARTSALPVGDLTLILGGAVYLTNPHAFKMWQVVVTDGSLDATAAAALSTAGHADTDPSGVSGVIEAFDFGRTATGVPSTDPANPTIINGIVRGSELYCNTTFTSPSGIVAL